MKSKQTSRLSAVSFASSSAASSHAMPPPNRSTEVSTAYSVSPSAVKVISSPNMTAISSPTHAFPISSALESTILFFSRAAGAGSDSSNFMRGTSEFSSSSASLARTAAGYTPESSPR